MKRAVNHKSPGRKHAGEAATNSKADSHKPSEQSRAPGVAFSNQGHQSDLWTTKYAPTSTKEIIGNSMQVKRLLEFLENWKPKVGSAIVANGAGRGKNFGSGYMRAVLISGPPGVGKTTAAHVVARSCGYNPLEINASDARSKGILQSLLGEVTDNRSITEFVGGNAHHTGNKVCVIMDEVDGMSARDRGGVVELIAMIKRTKVPILCLCNDRMSPKVRSLANYCYDLKFDKPTALQISKRIEEICRQEKLSVASNTIQVLTESTNGDIRQILNLLQTYSIKNRSLGAAESVGVSKEQEKDFTFNIFTLTSKLLDGQKFRQESLEQRFGYYFHDYSMVPLMVQENYLKKSPQIAEDVAKGNQKVLEFKTLELLSNAADSISDGDLVEQMIYGKGEWSLMPTHNVFSTLRPAFFVHGGSAPGFQSWNTYGFPSYLGRFSKQSKSFRVMRDIQLHMSFRASADKMQLRQEYLFLLLQRMTQPLRDQGSEGIDAVVALLDHYFLNKEDYDNLLELGLGPCRSEILVKPVATATKTALTRTLNKPGHPVPPIFNNFAAPVKASASVATNEADFEDAIVDSDGEEANETGKDDEAQADDKGNLENDKLVVKKASKADKSSATKRKSSSSTTSAKSTKKKK